MKKGSNFGTLNENVFEQQLAQSSTGSQNGFLTLRGNFAQWPYCSCHKEDKKLGVLLDYFSPFGMVVREKWLMHEQP